MKQQLLSIYFLQSKRVVPAEVLAEIKIVALFVMEFYTRSDIHLFDILSRAISLPKYGGT